MNFLIKIQQQLPEFWRLVTAATYLIGTFFALRAFMEFKVYGEMRVMMSQSTNIMKPLSTLFVAVVLLFFPDLTHIAVTSLFGKPEIERHLGPDVTQTWIILGNIVQIIGFVSFIRGWLLLARSAHSGGQQPGMVSRAIIHIVGGTLAVNVFISWELVKKMFFIN